MSFTTLFMAVVALSVVVPVILWTTTRRAIRRTRIASTIYRDRYDNSAVVRPNAAVRQLMERSRITLATPAGERPHRRQHKLFPFDRPAQRRP